MRNLVEGESNKHVTVRRAQHRNGRSKTELADALFNYVYSLRSDEHSLMVSAQRRAQAPSTANASASSANAPNDRQMQKLQITVSHLKKSMERNTDSKQSNTDL